jgi:hypothetical protein
MRVKQLPNALTTAINNKQKGKEQTEQITSSITKLATVEG